MAKGDKVKALIDIGNGQVIERIFEADKAGRTVEYDVDKKTGNFVVEVKGRAGTAVRTSTLRGDRVLIIEEVPV